MSEIIELFTDLFAILNTSKILGMPLIVWLIIPLLFTFLIRFIKGKK